MFEHWILSLLRTGRGRISLGLAAVVLGLAFCRIAWLDVHEERLLKKTFTTANAYVIESRTTRGMHWIDKTYDLRYSFQIPGTSASFRRAEAGTNRNDIWSSLPKERWEAACKSGRIVVLYAPCDPSINRPLTEMFSITNGSLFGLVFGTAVIAAGTICLLLQSIRYFGF